MWRWPVPVVPSVSCAGASGSSGGVLSFISWPVKFKGHCGICTHLNLVEISATLCRAYFRTEISLGCKFHLISFVLVLDRNDENSQKYDFLFVQLIKIENFLCIEIHENTCWEKIDKLLLWNAKHSLSVELWCSCLCKHYETVRNGTFSFRNPKTALTRPLLWHFLPASLGCHIPSLGTPTVSCWDSQRNYKGNRASLM